MHRTHYRTAALVCTLTCWTGVASAQVPPLSSALERAVATAKAAGLAGEIAIADRDGPVADAVLGLADRARQRPHRVGDRWLWASVTKQVVATLVMQQVEVDALSLDGTIRDYLPDFAGPSGDRVKLRALLQHQSGLPNPDDTVATPDDPPSFYHERGPRVRDGSRARAFCAGTPKSAPASGFAYNNCDYLVLGAILERVTGQSVADLVATRIARPFGLRSLRFAADGAPGGGAFAIGYGESGRRYRDVNVATFGAAGALTGTAADLLAFDRALLDDALVGPAARSVLWRGDPRLGYEALGAWSFPAPLRGCAEAVALVERRGDVAGIQVRNVIAPRLGRSIAIFTNDDTLDFGEVWQGKGLTHDLLSAAFCTPPER